MKLRIYTVYDCKGLFYGPPFYSQTDGSALRAFSEVVNDPSTPIGRHPRDYSLFFIGEFDDQHGEVLSVAPKQHIADGSVLLQVQEGLPGMALGSGNAEAARSSDVVNLERRR